MADLSGFTDEELEALAAQPEAEDLSGYSEEDLLAMMQEPDEEPSLTSQLGEAAQYGLENVVVPVGRFVDTYTGAPSRAAVHAGAMGENPLSAFLTQFGGDPEQAPTGKEIAQNFGVGETSASEVLPSLYSETGEGLPLKKGGFLDPTASGAAGLGVDIGADWTNLIPGALVAKRLAKGAGKAAAGTANLAAKAGAGASDLVTGTKAASKALEVGGAVTERAAKTIESILSPKQALTFPKSVEVAIKNGISPKSLSASVEFGSRSSISRGMRGLREGASGEHLLEAHQKGYADISDAIDRRIGKIAGGAIPDQLGAGEVIQQGFRRAQDELLNSADITYKSVQEYAPGLFINKDDLANLNKTLNGIEKSAKGLAMRGVTDAQKAEGRALIRSIDAVRRTKGSFKQSVEALQMLGKAAFKDKPVIGMVPPDIEKLRDIYFELSDALVGTVRKDVNPAFADELLANNKDMSSFFKDRKAISGALDQSKAGERVFQRYILNGDSKSIGILKSRLAPEELNQLKGAFVKSLVKETPDGLINFNQLANAMRQKKNQMMALFEPSELQDLVELVKLGEDYGPAIMSTSGTGASNRFANFFRSAAMGFADEKALEAMMARARGTQGAVDTAKGGTLPSMTVDTDQIRKSLRRGGIERRIKGVQSVAPSQYQDRNKRRLKALGE